MRAAPLVLLAVVSLALAGCASKSPTPTSFPTTNSTAPSKNSIEPVSLALSTTGQYPVNPGFSPTTLIAKSGANVTLKFTDADTADPAGAGLNPIQHGVKFEGFTAATKVISAGQTDTITFIAPAPGTYKYFCPVGDHRSRGMEGTFTVS